MPGADNNFAQTDARSPPDIRRMHIALERVSGPNPAYPTEAKPPKAPLMPSVVLVSHQLAGHRAAYVRQFTDLFEGWSWDVTLVRHWAGVLFDRRPVLFLMIEESLIGYAAAALWRALLGWRTTGLLFRAPDERSMRGRIKRAILTLLKRSATVTTISIVPFDANPSLAASCDGWIYDPQLWDIETAEPPSTLLSDQVGIAAGGRKVLLALGLQNTIKGFDLLCRTWLGSETVRGDWSFVAAGAVDDSLKDLAAEFAGAGGQMIDRFVTDEELNSLYGAADLVWCVYHPSYDQASGVFGRAFQFDVPALVRSDAAISRLSDAIGARSLQTTFDPAGVVRTLMDSYGTPLSPPHRLSVAVMAEQSQARLRRAVGLAG